MLCVEHLAYYAQQHIGIEWLLHHTYALVDEKLDNDVMEAIEFVKAKGKPFELAPKPGSVRKQQHLAIESARMRSESVGQEPNRRVRVLPIGR